MREQGFRWFYVGAIEPEKDVQLLDQLARNPGLEVMRSRRRGPPLSGQVATIPLPRFTSLWYDRPFPIACLPPQIRIRARTFPNSPSFLSSAVSESGRGARLRSLLEQSAIDRMEILLFDLGPETCPALPGSDHPRVRLTRRAPRDLLATARADGVRAARSSGRLLHGGAL